MKSKKIFFFLILLIIFLMSVGYASFATDINLDGTVKIDGKWDVKITDIEEIDTCASCDAGALIFSDTTATFNAALLKPGDYVTCIITIMNAGTIPAKLEDVITKSDEEPKELVFTTTRPQEILNPGETTTYNITVTYDENTTTLPEKLSKNFTTTIKYVQE